MAGTMASRQRESLWLPRRRLCYDKQPMKSDIVLCRCIHRAFYPPGALDAVQHGLTSAGHRVTLVDDLCAWAADRDPRLKSAVSDGGPVTVVACYPRAVQWLLQWAGAGSPAVPVQVYNLRTQPADDILRQLGGKGLCDTPTASVSEYVPSPAARRGIGDDSGRLSQVPEEANRNAYAVRSEYVRSSGETVASPSDVPMNQSQAAPWVPWFPVLDFDRCVHCRQCVSFCPFGVYAVADGKVTVTAPRNCKDNCPACARMCPKQAIIFPKVPDSPINGDRVTEEAVQEARQRLEEQTKALAEEDLHSILAKRKLRARLRQT